jgi:hypothetical protein
MLLIFHRPTPPSTLLLIALDNRPTAINVQSGPSLSTARPQMMIISSAAYLSAHASTSSFAAPSTPRAAVVQIALGMKKYSKRPSKIWILSPTTKSLTFPSMDPARSTTPALPRQLTVNQSSTRSTRCQTRHSSASIKLKAPRVSSHACRVLLARGILSLDTLPSRITKIRPSRAYLIANI